MSSSGGNTWARVGSQGLGSVPPGLPLTKRGRYAAGMKIILMILGLLVVAVGLAAAAVRYETEPLVWHQSFDAPGCCVDITHAGGLLDGQPYTNSLEALQHNYDKGRRIFEIDLIRTADDRIVLAHDWDAYEGKPPSHEEFLADGNLTRLDLEGFVAWVMSTCTDCRIVTDSKFDFWDFWPEYVAAVPAVVRSRQFIVQVYDLPSVHALADRAPKQQQILTLYRVKSVSDEELEGLSAVGNLLAVTMPVDRVPWQAVNTMNLTGKPVFTHGYPWTMESELVLRLARLFGVTGFYKD